METNLNLTEGRRLRDQGAQRAVDHADAVSAQWRATAGEYLRKHGRRLGAFLIEQVRAAAEAEGLPAPPDKRAWGGVALAAAREGLIERIGYRPNSAANCHASPKSLWQWVGK